MRYSSRQALEGVVERAGRLAGSPLAKQTSELGVRWSPPDPPTVTGPDQPATEAALRLARQFFQAEDALSLARVADRLGDDPDISDGFKRDLGKLIRRLDAALDQPPPMRFKIRGEVPPTYREILDVFLHGNVEHLDPARREPLAEWLGQPTRALLVRAQLQSALSDVCKTIDRLRALCQRELLRAAG